MGWWNGSYETSKEGQRSLEDDIYAAGKGMYAYGSDDGVTVKHTDDTINVYGPSDTSSNGHWHEGVTVDGRRYGHD